MGVIADKNRKYEGAAYQWQKSWCVSVYEEMIRRFLLDVGEARELIAKRCDLGQEFTETCAYGAVFHTAAHLLFECNLLFAVLDSFLVD